MRRGFYAALGALGCCALWAVAPVAAQQQQEVITFVPGPQLPVFAGPAYVAAGDFNGDGIADAVVSHDFSAKLAVLLTKPDGSGTFLTSLSYPIGRRLRGVIATDLNGDHILDIAVVDNVLNRVFVLYGQGQNGKGNGTFGTPPHSFLVGVRAPVALAAGNFDNKNGPDLVTANGLNNTITVLLNQGGTKGFTVEPNIPVGNTRANPRSVATADLNADGLDDIVVLNSPLAGAAGEVAVLLNNGMASFTTVNRFLVGRGSRAMAVADFNGDGAPDIAVLNGATTQPNVYSVNILLNNTTTTASGQTRGTGFFTVLPPFFINCPPQLNGVPVTCTPQDIETADFNADGFMDLAISFSTTAVTTVQAAPPGFVNVYAGRGDGNFDFATEVAVGLGPRQIAVADFTGDHLPDILVTENGSNTVRILRAVAPPPKPIGQPCTASTQCQSANCVDQRCCEVSACPSGEFCNIANQEGSCALPAGNGSTCKVAAQCQSGNCVGGFCCSSASCMDGDVCNTGNCTPPVINGTPCNDDLQCQSGACVDSTCCDQATCPAGQFCNIPGFLGTCTPPAPNGTMCTDPAQCSSGNCVDRTCCASPVCDPGFACNVSGNLGVCTMLPTQTPAPSQTPTLTPTPVPTATASPTFTPTPQPNSAACAAAEQCMSGFCINDVCCGLPGGMSSCPTGQRCDITNKAGTCDSVGLPGQSCFKDTDCGNLNCDLSTHLCGAAARTATPTLTLTPTATPTPLALAASCTSTAQCGSGLFCTNGVCCTQAQCPSGQSCNVAGSQGQCATIPQPNGFSCNGAGDCLSGNCTDGFCCNLSPCPQGEFCDIDTHEGTCSLPNDAGGPCNVNADCATGLICLSGPPATCGLPPSPSPTFPPFPTATPVLGPEVSVSRGGGCSIGGGGGAGAWMLAALPIVLWLRRRREWVAVERRRGSQ